MATKWSTSFLLLLSIFLLISSSLALSSRREDEREREREWELQQCRQQCQQQQQQPHHDRGKQRQCEQQCVEQQREREQESERERERGDDSRRKDPEERLEECRQRCTQRRPGQQQQYCESQCEKRFQEEEEREQEGGQQGRDESRRRDPEQRFEECRQHCRQGQKGQRKQRQCEEQCRERYEEEEERREQEGGKGSNNPEERRDPEERLEECRQHCQQSQQEEQQKYQCQQQCEERYKQERSQGGGSSSSSSEEERSQGEEEEEEEERSRNNPYVFRRESFIDRVRTQHGSIRVLRNFLQRSKLLMGIANYRLVIFEANPRTFAVPKYSDAEQVFFVTRGEGTVTLLRINKERDQSQSIKRESHNIRKGSIIRVQAGTVVYIINNSNNRKLQIAKLVQPVFFPGQFKDFYIGGGENPESIYRTFSTSILEAALNTQQEKLQRLFGRQGQGAIVQASEEQIRSMSRHSSEGGHRPFGGHPSKPFNLLEKRPDHSNQRGQLYIADFEDYQELRDLDVHVTFANITSGSMMAPFFESKATKIGVVVDGRGEFEMVSPHLSSQSGKGQESEQEEEESEGQHRYQKVRSRLARGTVFIVPAGHPTAIIASQEQNLQVVCFEVHAKNSKKVFLTGRNNVVNQMEREAAELSFGVHYKLIEEVFGRSRDEVFVRGPRQSREGRQEEEQGGSNPLEAFLEFAGF